MIEALDGLGYIVFKDDEKDFIHPERRFSFPGHPSPLHHWQLGLAMQAGAKLIRGLSELLDLLDVFDEKQHPLELEVQQVLEGLAHGR